MLDNLHSNTDPSRRVKPHAAPKSLSFTEHLERIETLSDRAYTIYYGRHGEYLAALLLLERSSDGSLPHYRHVQPIEKAAGVVGFAIANGPTVDYTRPDTLQASRSILQGSAAGLVGFMANFAEQVLYHAFRHPDPTIDQARQAAGLKPLKAGLVGRRAASRLAAALVHLALKNAIGPGAAGAHALLLALPPSFRPENMDVLGPGPQAILLRDTLAQLAILLLVPVATRTWAAGRKRKDVLAALGLPRNAHKLTPRAVGLISWRLRRPEGEDVDSEMDLSWLTEDFLDALPDASFRQRLACDLAIRALIRIEREPQKFNIWFAAQTVSLKSEGDFREPARIELVDYVAADRDQLRRAAVRPWSAAMGLAETCDRASAFAGWVRDTNHALPSTLFPTPSWAPAPGPVAGSRWNLIRVENGAMLSAEARRFDNCAHNYFRECTTGASAIFVMRRKATKADEPSTVHDCPIIGGPAVSGSMVEFRARADGTPRIVQHFGVHNAEPPASCTDALHRLLPRA
jgi:hypothetical protein